MFKWLRLHPTLNFCRIIYILSDNCAWRECVISIFNVNNEIKECLLSLYLNSIVYMILAMYFDNVIPQTYGIPKHPLFFVEK